MVAFGGCHLRLTLLWCWRISAKSDFRVTRTEYLSLLESDLGEVYCNYIPDFKIFQKGFFQSMLITYRGVVSTNTKHTRTSLNHHARRVYGLNTFREKGPGLNLSKKDFSRECLFPRFLEGTCCINVYLKMMLLAKVMFLPPYCCCIQSGRGVTPHFS